MSLKTALGRGIRSIEISCFEIARRRLKEALEALQKATQQLRKFRVHRKRHLVSERRKAVFCAASNTLKYFALKNFLCQSAGPGAVDEVAQTVAARQREKDDGILSRLTLSYPMLLLRV